MARTEVTGAQIKDTTVSLTADVTGTLPVANGGTGNATNTLGSLLVGNGTGAVTGLAPGNSGNVVGSSGSAFSSVSPWTLKQFETYHDFSTKSNGAVATNADSGQAWIQTWPTGGSAAQPSVASGYFINADTTAAASYGSYLTIQLAAGVTYLESDFTFYPGSGGGSTGATDFGALGLVAWTTSLGSGAQGLGTIPDSPCHVSFGPVSAQIGVFVSNVLTTVGTVYYPRIATNDVHVEVVIDKVNSCVYVRGPDRAVNRFSHSAMGTQTATYACCETYNFNGATDKKVRVHQFAADSALIGSQKYSSYKAQAVVNDYYAQNAITHVYRSGGNIVIDPSFEDDAVWSGAWGANTTTQKLAGAKSRMITADGTFNRINFIHDISGDSISAPTVPGRIYYAECWLLKDAANAGTSNLYLQPRSVDSAGTETALTTVTIAQATLSTTVWAKSACYFLIPAGGVGFVCPLYTDAAVPAGNKFYIDSLIVQDVTESYGIMVGSTAINAKLAAGTTTVAPLTFQSGTSLTTPVAGVQEYDGAVFYGTPNTTSGRGLAPVDQMFRLAADSSAIGGGIADYFGTNSAFSYVAGGVYEIVWYLFYTKTTAGTVTYTITSSSAPVSLSAFYTQTPVGGIGAVGAPQTAGLSKSTSTTAALPVTGSLTTAVQHQAEVHAVYVAHASTPGTVRLRATESAGTITPLRESFYRVRRLPAGNVGTFAA